MLVLFWDTYVVDEVYGAAGGEAEGDGVSEVTKQLEKQAVDDKEKEEDGEEGDYFFSLL